MSIYANLTPAKFALRFALLILAGIIFVVVGVLVKINTDKKINTYTKTEAVIVDYDMRHTSDGIMYAEIAEFELDGKTYQVTSNISTTHPQKIGTKVTIYYNSETMNDFVFEQATNGFINLFLIFAICFSIFGIVLTIVETIKYRKSRREAQQVY